MHRQLIALTAVLGIVHLVFPLRAPAQGLATVAASHSIEFGFLASPENLSSEEYRDSILADANVITATTYWMGQTRPSAGVFDFSAPDQVVAFGLDHDLEIHGHPLIWSHDDYLPNWVFQIQSSEEATEVFRQHIQTTAARYRGAISVWHVVNEAFIYTGERRDNFWLRTIGEDFIELAFRTARATDLDATLIYNDFGLLELDDRKYEAVKDELVRVRNNGAPIDGIGWQSHLTPEKVLDPDFPMEFRMQEMSLLGFTNYITELDIELTSNTPENLALQAAAYRKIGEIFKRVLKRGAMQTWDVSDRQSWLGTAAAPLLFDEDYEPKPGYFDLFDSLLVEEPALDEPAASQLFSELSLDQTQAELQTVNADINGPQGWIASFGTNPEQVTTNDYLSVGGIGGAGQFFNVNGDSRNQMVTCTALKASSWSGFGVTYYDANFNEIRVQRKEITADIRNGDPETRYSISLVPPANAAYGYMWVWNDDSSGYVQLDDFRVVSY